jgi:hypothetical protein
MANHRESLVGGVLHTEHQLVQRVVLLAGGSERLLQQRLIAMQRLQHGDAGRRPRHGQPAPPDEPPDQDCPCQRLDQPHKGQSSRNPRRDHANRGAPGLAQPSTGIAGARPAIMSATIRALPCDMVQPMCP